MRNARDPRWYRAEAARMRLEAARATDNPELRDSFLALSLQYERLVVVLEKSAAKYRGARSCFICSVQLERSELVVNVAKVQVQRR